MKAVFLSCFLILGLCIMSWPPSAKAEPVRLFAAAGTNFSFPDSVRAGYGGWELGKLQKGVYGLTRSYFSGPTYFSFGPAVAGFGQWAGGVFGSAGFRYQLLSVFHLRGELTAVAVHTGVARGGALLGVSVVW